MPVYEFTCRGCGSSFEVLVRGSETVVACPECGAVMLEKRISVPAPANTGGERQPGQTCCGGEERCARPPCSEGGRCRRD